MIEGGLKVQGHMGAQFSGEDLNQDVLYCITCKEKVLALSRCVC